MNTPVPRGDFARAEDMALPDSGRGTPAFLRAVGELLFGERWQTPMAARLGAIRGKALSPATIHQWTTQKRSIPAWVREALSVTLDEARSDMETRAEIAGVVARRMRETAADPQR